MRLGRFVGAWLLVGTMAGAQQKQQQQQQSPAPIERGPVETIHVESRLVNVALNVVDEHGAPVPGLSMDDFELAEDGKPQKIAFFERESSTPLKIVLGIDSSGSVMIDAKLEEAAAKSFVKSILRPQDRLDLTDFS